MKAVNPSSEYRVVEQDLDGYQLMKARIKELTATAEVYKKRLLQYVEEEGEEDDKGHVWLVLPDGRELKKQRSVTKILDEDFAIPFLEADPVLAETCLVWVLTVDDDAIMAARYKKLISDDDIKKIYPEQEKFSFVLPGK